jgi:beta-lactamase superfamily II metal-dependent hydrolase
MSKRKRKSSAEKDAEMIAKAYHKSKHKWVYILLLIIILVAGGTVFYLYYTHKLGNSSSDTSSSQNVSQTSVDTSSFSVHFMELGNASAGDSIYIKAGDTDILIDAGSETSSAPVIEKYVDTYCTDKKLEYVIVTHGDFDHISGMYGTNKNGILYYYSVGTLIDTGLTNKTTVAYKTYYANARANAVSNGAKYYTAAQCWNQTDGASRKYALADGISMDILYNYYYFNNSSDENNYSVCTLFTCGNTHFLLTGDLELDGETQLASYYDGSTSEKTLPQVNLFKAGHHGSKTSSNSVLLQKIRPEICCVSCCAGGSQYTNIADNTFPTQQFISRIANYTSQVYVTSMIDNDASKAAGQLVNKPMNGTITVSSDGNAVSVSATNNTTILKETDWFKKTIYVDSEGKYCSGVGKVDYYTSSTSGVSSRAQRTWPSTGK